jgi:hypothetical protein
MTTPAELYVDNVREKLRLYFAAWLPTSPHALGDVGILDGNFFQRVTSLADLGIPFEEMPPGGPGSLDIVSDSGVQINYKLGGESSDAMPSIPHAEAGVAVEFGSQGAFVIKATRTEEVQIRDIAGLQRDILAAFRAGQWQPDWAAIVRVVNAEHAFILISQSAHAKVEFSAGANVGGPVKLGDASTSLQVTRQSGDVVRVDGGGTVTPLFQLARIHRRLLRGPEVRITKGIETATGRVDASTLEDLRRDPAVAEQLYLDLIQD